MSSSFSSIYKSPQRTVSVFGQVWRGVEVYLDIFSTAEVLPSLASLGGCF